MPLGDFNDFPHSVTVGMLCPICGAQYINAVGHGWGVCKGAQNHTTRYISVTPDEMRQIVREELDAALKKYGLPQPGESK